MQKFENTHISRKLFFWLKINAPKDCLNCTMGKERKEELKWFKFYYVCFINFLLSLSFG